MLLQCLQFPVADDQTVLNVLVTCHSFAQMDTTLELARMDSSLLTPQLIKEVW